MSYPIRNAVSFDGGKTVGAEEFSMVSNALQNAQTANYQLAQENAALHNAFEDEVLRTKLRAELKELTAFSDFFFREDPYGSPLVFKKNKAESCVAHRLTDCCHFKVIPVYIVKEKRSEIRISYFDRCGEHGFALPETGFTEKSVYNAFSRQGGTLSYHPKGIPAKQVFFEYLAYCLNGAPREVEYPFGWYHEGERWQFSEGKGGFDLSIPLLTENEMESRELMMLKLVLLARILRQRNRQHAFRRPVFIVTQEALPTEISMDEVPKSFANHFSPWAEKPAAYLDAGLLSAGCTYNNDYKPRENYIWICSHQEEAPQCFIVGRELSPIGNHYCLPVYIRSPPHEPGKFHNPATFRDLIDCIRNNPDAYEAVLAEEGKHAVDTDSEHPACAELKALQMTGAVVEWFLKIRYPDDGFSKAFRNHVKGTLSLFDREWDSHAVNDSVQLFRTALFRAKQSRIIESCYDISEPMGSCFQTETDLCYDDTFYYIHYDLLRNVLKEIEGQNEWAVISNLKAQHFLLPSIRKTIRPWEGDSAEYRLWRIPKELVDEAGSLSLLDY